MEQEINIFGVYISPFAVVLGLGLLVFLPVRACLDRLQFDKYVWHRPLADACIYVIVVGLLVLTL
jgi:protein AaeX